MDQVAERLRYDPATGIFTWKVKPSARVKIGDVAGKLRADGYRIIRCGGSYIYAHRLAWLLSYGHLPSLPLDHINGNRDDNRITNLRVVTASQNTINQKLRADNKAGAKGVQWLPGRAKPWRARIKVGRRVRTIGYYETAEEAGAAYERAASDVHGQFARRG